MWWQCSRNVEIFFSFFSFWTKKHTHTHTHNVWSIETNEIKYLRVNCASSVRFMNNFGSRDTRQPEGICLGRWVLITATAERILACSVSLGLHLVPFAPDPHPLATQLYTSLRKPSVHFIYCVGFFIRPT